MLGFAHQIYLPNGARFRGVWYWCRKSPIRGRHHGLYVARVPRHFSPARSRPIWKVEMSLCLWELSESDMCMDGLTDICNSCDHSGGIPNPRTRFPSLLSEMLRRRVRTSFKSSNLCEEVVGCSNGIALEKIGNGMPSRRLEQSGTFSFSSLNAFAIATCNNVQPTQDTAKSSRSPIAPCLSVVHNWASSSCPWLVKQSCLLLCCAALSMSEDMDNIVIVTTVFACMDKNFRCLWRPLLACIHSHKLNYSPRPPAGPAPHTWYCIASAGRPICPPSR